MQHPNPDDRAQAIHWAKSVVADSCTVFLDSETTGLDAAAEVLELAILDAAGHPLYHARFKPAAPIPPEASAIHGIFDRDVAHAPRFVDAWPEIAALLAGKRVITYNADFDQSMVQQTLHRYNVPYIPDRLWECAMEAYAAWYGAWSPWHGSYTFKSLAFAAAATGDHPDHSALGDARACRAVVRRLAVEEP